MYTIAHTESIILGGKSVGESDRLLYLYTRDHGLLFAQAKSVREGKSKLRYGLQFLSHAKVDLVQGKAGWKLISAEPVRSFSETLARPRHRRVAALYTTLVQRLVQGEEAHAELFVRLIESLELLDGLPNEKHLDDVELLIVIRLLDLLGYWRTNEGEEQRYIQGACSMTDELSEFIAKQRMSLTGRVNQALRETQL